MIEICFLSKHPQLIPKVSIWLEKEFHHLLPNESKKEFADDLVLMRQTPIDFDRH